MDASGKDAATDSASPAGSTVPGAQVSAGLTQNRPWSKHIRVRQSLMPAAAQIISLSE